MQYDGMELAPRQPRSLHVIPMAVGKQGNRLFSDDSSQLRLISFGIVYYTKFSRISLFLFIDLYITLTTLSTS